MALIQVIELIGEAVRLREIEPATAELVINLLCDDSTIAGEIEKAKAILSKWYAKHKKEAGTTDL
jgi:hypothetical protein